jgi:NADH:ubiquinone oxidoreductase subunit 6 (subunit J)
MLGVFAIVASGLLGGVAVFVAKIERAVFCLWLSSLLMAAFYFSKGAMFLSMAFVLVSSLASAIVLVVAGLLGINFDKIQIKKSIMAGIILIFFFGVITFFIGFSGGNFNGIELGSGEPLRFVSVGRAFTQKYLAELFLLMFTSFLLLVGMGVVSRNESKLK